MVYQLQRPSIEMIIDYCRDLLADEKLEVYEFGQNCDLVLHIYKDATEKVFILHKAVQYKVFLFVLIYYIMCIKIVFQWRPIRMGSILHPRTKIFLTWSGFTLPETESGWMTQTILI